jgi:hypothetical protein
MIFKRRICMQQILVKAVYDAGESESQWVPDAPP